MNRRPRRALSRGEHPRLHGDARRGRQRRSGVEGRRRQGPRHRDAGVLRRGAATMVVNPTWHIPNSIAIRDYLPKLQRDPMVLKRQGIRLLTRARHRDQPQAGRLHPVHAGELPVPHQAAAERRQCARPGQVHVPERALGLHARHAAPGAVRRATRGRSRTAASGWRSRSSWPTSCSTGQVADPAAAFAGWVAAAKERAVTLERPIPVHIVYRTVIVRRGRRRALPRRTSMAATRRCFEALEAAGRDFARCAGLTLPL